QRASSTKLLDCRANNVRRKQLNSWVHQCTSFLLKFQTSASRAYKASLLALESAGRPHRYGTPSLNKSTKANPPKYAQDTIRQVNPPVVARPSLPPHSGGERFGNCVVACEKIMVFAVEQRLESVVGESGLVG
ncbi:hypothetical protein BN1723_000218, partial [Verticillium longisporum]